MNVCKGARLCENALNTSKTESREDCLWNKRAVAVAIIDGFEFAAVDGDDRLREEIEVAVDIDLQQHRWVCVRASPSINRFMIVPDTIQTIRRLDNHWCFHTAWAVSYPSPRAAVGLTLTLSSYQAVTLQPFLLDIF
ncbi:hypothetical protein EYC95_25630 [Pseudomonas sp. BGI-2]|nr:hypothetical protein EYC95_25630 [Pseudomonas sp. BGI-2]